VFHNFKWLLRTSLVTFAFLTPSMLAAADAVGAYLAARSAGVQNDFASAAEYYDEVLKSDPSNPAVLESAVIANISLGEIDNAVVYAQAIADQDLRSQAAHMALLVNDVLKDDYESVLTRIKDDRGLGGAFADGMIKGWAEFGRGDIKSALATFDFVASEDGVSSFALYHKSLMLASAGAFEEADKILSGTSGVQIQPTRRGTIAWAQVLSQLERNKDAIEVIDSLFGRNLDPEVADLRARLVAGETVGFQLVKGTQAGMAEVFYSLGQALREETSDDYALIYAQLAVHLKPKHADAVIMSAELQEALGLFDLARQMPPSKF